MKEWNPKIVGGRLTTQARVCWSETPQTRAEETCVRFV